MHREASKDHGRRAGGSEGGAEHGRAVCALADVGHLGTIARTRANQCWRVLAVVWAGSSGDQKQKRSPIDHCVLALTSQTAQRTTCRSCSADRFTPPFSARVWMKHADVSHTVAPRGCAERTAMYLLAALLQRPAARLLRNACSCGRKTRGKGWQIANPRKTAGIPTWSQSHHRFNTNYPRHIQQYSRHQFLKLKERRACCLFR